MHIEFIVIPYHLFDNCEVSSDMLFHSWYLQFVFYQSCQWFVNFIDVFQNTSSSFHRFSLFLSYKFHCFLVPFIFIISLPMLAKGLLCSSFSRLLRWDLRLTDFRLFLFPNICILCFNFASALLQLCDTNFDMLFSFLLLNVFKIFFPSKFLIDPWIIQKCIQF